MKYPCEDGRLKESNQKGKFIKVNKRNDFVSLMSSTYSPKETDVSHYDRISQTLNVNALLTEYRKNDDKNQYSQRPLSLDLNRR